MEIQAYTTGAGDWTVPAGVYKADALIVGGGGGGGGYSGNANAGGGGGGGGEVVQIRDFITIPGETIPYVVGAGGAGGAAGDNNGVTGDPSSFAGIVAAAGLLGNKASVKTGGDGGGVNGGTGGATAVDGGDGTESGVLIIRIGGGGGGGGGVLEPITYGGAGGMGVFIGGIGGEHNGGGGGGSLRAGGAGSTDADGVAAAANSGGGGGGAAEYIGATSHAGGAGGSGYIRITWEVDIGAISDEVAKVPKSDSTVTWNATALASIKTQALAVMTDANTELAAVPASTGGLRAMIQHLFEGVRHVKTMNKDTGVETLMKDDGSTPLGTATHSDDGTTVTRGEMT